MRTRYRVLALRYYPVKSLAAVVTESAYVERRGLRGDRRWMLVDGKGELDHSAIIQFTEKLAQVEVRKDN